MNVKIVFSKNRKSTLSIITHIFTFSGFIWHFDFICDTNFTLDQISKADIYISTINYTNFTAATLNSEILKFLQSNSLQCDINLHIKHNFKQKPDPVDIRFLHYSHYIQTSFSFSEYKLINKNKRQV